MQTHTPLSHLLSQLGAVMQRHQVDGHLKVPPSHPGATLSHACLRLASDEPGRALSDGLLEMVGPTPTHPFIEKVEAPGSSRATWYRLNEAQSARLFGLRWLCVTPPCMHHATGISTVCFHDPAAKPTDREMRWQDPNLPSVQLLFCTRSTNAILGRPEEQPQSLAA